MILPFLSIYLTSELCYSKEDAGFIMAFFGVGALLGSFVGGYLTDKFGHFIVQTGSLFLGGCAFYTLQFLDDVIWQWCLLLATATFLADAFRPAMFVAVKEYAHPETQTRSITLIRLMINLGIAFGPAIGGFMAITYGYEWLFILDGGTCVMAGVFMLLFLRHTFYIPEQKTAAQKLELKQKSPFKDKYFLFMMGMNLLCIMVFCQFFSIYTLFMKEELGYSEDIIGYVLVLNGLLIFFFEMPLVHDGEKKMDRNLMISIGTAMIGLAFVIFYIAHWAPLLIVILSIILITFGEMLNFPFLNAKVLDATPEGAEGAYMGMYTMVWPLAMIIAPYLGLKLVDDFGFNAAWFACGLLSAAASYGFYIQDQLFADKQKEKHPL